jgi:ribonucleoside-diphosphate reductase beta chain
MREADAVEIVESAQLDDLKNVSADVVYRHVDFLARELPGPIDLYQRWERQQWSATALDFGIDRQQWAAAPPHVVEQLETTFSGFFYGEQAVTDTLSPLLMGAPDEEQRLFLSTQVVDEARHSYFFARFYNEVLGVEGGLRGALASLSLNQEPGSGYNVIFDPRRGELATSTDAVRLDPGNYGSWVQAITVYHLMVEGLLALTGQRRALRLLRTNDLLPAFRAGFTAVTRDESRHVSYGIWALRQAVRAGHEADIQAVVDRTLTACIRVYANPGIELPDPRQAPPAARVDPMDTWTFAVDSVCKRLRTAGVTPEYVTAVEERSWSVIWQYADEYEQIHHAEHPVRLWQRGEVQAAAAEAEAS